MTSTSVACIPNNCVHSPARTSPPLQASHGQPCSVCRIRCRIAVALGHRYRQELEPGQQGGDDQRPTRLSAMREIRRACCSNRRVELTHCHLKLFSLDRCPRQDQLTAVSQQRCIAQLHAQQVQGKSLISPAGIGGVTAASPRRKTRPAGWSMDAPSGEASTQAGHAWHLTISSGLAAHVANTRESRFRSLRHVLAERLARVTGSGGTPWRRGRYLDTTPGCSASSRLLN
jgi:hypothetical protein